MWIRPACVPPVASQTWTVIHSVPQFTKSEVCYLGSDPCLCSSKLSPWVQTLLWDCSHTFPPVISLTISGSLGLPFPFLWPESWGFSFSTLLGIFHWVYVQGQTSREQNKKKAEEIYPTFSEPQFLPQSFKCLPTHCCHCAALPTANRYCLGLEVEEKGKRQNNRGRPPLSDPQEILFCSSNLQEGASLRALSVCAWYMCLGSGLPLSPSWATLEEEKW